MAKYNRRDFEDVGVFLDQSLCFMPFYDKALPNGRLNINYKMAADSATNLGGTLSTGANIGLPTQYFTQIDPNIIKVLYSAMNAEKLFPSRKLGDITQDYVTFPVQEYVGEVTAYSDFTNNTLADVNYNWPTRQIHRYQTGYVYGDLESLKSAEAKIQLASQKQEAAALTMAKYENSVYLRGVEGIKLYGLMNDPNLDEPISPLTATVGGEEKTKWADKVGDPVQGANLIFNDVMALWAEILRKNGGQIDVNSPVTLAMSHNMQRYLTTANNYNVSVLELLQKTLPSIEVVVIPEFSTTEGEYLYMICPSILGQSVGFNAFAEKLRMSPIIQHTSYLEQKVSAATWGCVITQPSLIASMVGI